MTAIPKLTFGTRQDGDPITYNILVDGAVVGELKRYPDADGFCTDTGLEELGLTTTERTAQKAQRDLKACWKAFNDSERLLVIALGRTRRMADTGETPAAEPPKPVKAKAEPKAPKAKTNGAEAPAASGGALTQAWIDSDPKTSRSDGLNGLRLSFEKGRSYYYLSVIKGAPKRTLGNAKPGHAKWISLEEARRLAAERSTELAGD